MTDADDSLTECDERSPLIPPKRENTPEDGNTEAKQPTLEHKSRWWSIRVMYLTMFLSSITFTLCISSIWPYLQLMDADATENFLGWVVAAYSLGQLIASPLFGFWANWRRDTRTPLIVSISIACLSNVLYAYIESFPNHRGYYLILARGLIGFGAGNVAVVRSYVAGATSLKERTSAMANISIFQSIGFILGPVVQSALVPIHYPGPINIMEFHLNMYTVPAFLGAIMCIINIFLLVAVFREYRVPDEDADTSIQYQNTDIIPKYRPDLFAVISTIIIFFIVLFIFTVFETIGTPLTMNMYGWTKSKATLYQGIILSIAGVEAVGVFIVIKVLAKRFNERYLLLGGFIICLAGYFLLIPWGDKQPVIAYVLLQDSMTSENFTHLTLGFTTKTTAMTADITTTALSNVTVEPEGCPPTRYWCLHTPAVQLAQYLSSTVLISAGYPTASVMTYTLYSKILGPKPQGVWMGWLTASGSLARTLGPIFVAQIYDKFGPRITFASDCGIILLTVVAVIIVFRRLVPFHFSADVESTCAGSANSNTEDTNRQK